jgi:hypothetical protein
MNEKPSPLADDPEMAEKIAAYKKRCESRRD